MNHLDHTTLALAREAGATHLIVGTAHPRQLYTQLAYHLTQLQRMLGATEAECGASIRKLSLLRALAELAIDQRRIHPDEERAKLERWLDLERRKFLMATRADALALVGRRTTATTAREIVRGSVVEFRARLKPAAVHRLSNVPNQVVAELERALGHLDEPVPLASIANTQVTIRAFAADLDAVTPVGGLFARLRIERAAREELGDGLERGTQQATQLVLRDYDDIRATLDQHVLELTESWVETAKAAAEFARRAREGSGEYTARAQVARWFLALAKISAETH